jgi:hypothetical protein
MLEPAWLTEDWKCLSALLPEGWRQQARTCGALRRSRQISTPDELLRLLLLHVGAGLSLRQTVARGLQHGLPGLSDVALLKRLRHAGPWLRWLCEAMLREAGPAPSWKWLPAGLRVVAVDASTVSEPGSSGTDWRVHHSIELPSLLCDQVHVTDARGGESLTRFQVRPGDLVLADRGYCRAPQLAHVLRHGGHFIVRWHSRCLPVDLRDGGGRAFNLFKWLDSIQGKEAAEVAVKAKGVDAPLRLCAVRVSPQAAERELARVKQSARKSRCAASASACRLAGFVIVATSMTSGSLPADHVMQMFRLRWQVELAFKRLKSLLQAGHVPKQDPASATAWLQGKLLASLLAERLLEESGLFSPWGYPLPERQPVA